MLKNFQLFLDFFSFYRYFPTFCSLSYCSQFFSAMDENQNINRNNFYIITDEQQLLKTYDLDSFAFGSDKMEAFPIGPDWVINTTYHESKQPKGRKLLDGLEKKRNSNPAMLRLPVDWTEFW